MQAVLQTPSESKGTLIDPRALMSIRSLELRARVVVEGFWSGLHRSPYHGFSAEFTEYRQYSPGDDPRYLDWRVLARSDRYFLKRFEDETNLRCHLVVDQSRSMAFGSAGWTKAAYGATLGATLGYFLHVQGDAIGLMTFDSTVREQVPPRHRFGHLRRLMLALEQPSAGEGTDLAAPLERVAELVRKRGLVVLISDFLAPLERLEPALLRLAARRHEIVLFQVLDPQETRFEFRDAAQFEDLETGQRLTLDPGVIRTEYLRRLEAHGEELRRLCARLGCAWHRLETDRPLELALFDFLKGRTQRGRLVRRGLRPGGGGA